MWKFHHGKWGCVTGEGVFSLPINKASQCCAKPITPDSPSCCLASLETEAQVRGVSRLAIYELIHYILVERQHKDTTWTNSRVKDENKPKRWMISLSCKRTVQLCKDQVMLVSQTTLLASTDRQRRQSECIVNSDSDGEVKTTRFDHQTRGDAVKVEEG